MRSAGEQLGREPDRLTGPLPRPVRPVCLVRNPAKRVLVNVGLRLRPDRHQL